MGDRQIEVQFEQLMLSHLDAAHNLARWLTGSDSDAADVVQESYTRALTYFAGFRGGDSRAWMLRIVRNTCYTWLRQNRRMNLSTPFDETIHSAAHQQSPREAIDPEALKNAIAALPVDYREVLILREVEELAYKEIAHIADIPIGTVMSRLARARQMLRTQLKGSAS